MQCDESQLFLQHTYGEIVGRVPPLFVCMSAIGWQK